MKRFILVTASTCCLISTATSQWSTPVPMTALNTSASDYAPVPTFDGLSLYYSTDVMGNSDIYRATRTSRYGPFGAPVRLPELASNVEDWMSCVRVDDLEVFFMSRRGPGNGYDLWRAERSSTSVPFNPPVPVTELNSASAEFGASLTLDGLRVYFTSERSGSRDIWTATRPNWSSPFGTPVPVVELNTPDEENDPRISLDGLSIMFASDRLGGRGNTDLLMASRLDTSLPFGNIVNLTVLNSPGYDDLPSFTTFGDEVFFSVYTPGRPTNWDLYTARFTGLRGLGIASQGSAQDLLFSDPSSPGSLYVAAASSRTSPGIPIDTRVWPLNPDLLFRLTFGGLPPVLTGYVGVLDPDGVASGRISFAGFPGLAGLRFFTSFIVLDPWAPSSVRTIGNAHETLVQ